MNSYIKHIIEAFDFNSINKKKESINLYKSLPQILEKVKISNIAGITPDEYNILSSCIGVYKVIATLQLKDLIKICIKQFGYNCNLNWIDTSEITDMSSLFQYSHFNGDISKWDVSNVKDMHWMFWESSFDGDISSWDVSNVTDMSGMFDHSSFKGDISLWNVSNVTNMHDMFFNSKFNGDISQWDVSKVTDMNDMFWNSEFNVDISKWDVNNVTDMEEMFTECPIKEEYKPKFKRKHNL